jgi:hypothetical protein
MFGTDFSGILLDLQQMKNKHDAQPKDTSMLWTKQGSQVDRLIRQEVNIPISQSNWRLHFTMGAKSNFGDIALDSMDLKRGPCEHKYDCDFELGTMCRWENVTGSEPGNITSAQHWTVVKGFEVAEKGPFPLIDHSAMSWDGHYLTVDMGANAALFVTARFASKLFGDNFGTLWCLSSSWCL